MIERLGRVPVEVDYTSEWRYRDPILAPDTITMLISQIGRDRRHHRGAARG